MQFGLPEGNFMTHTLSKYQKDECYKNSKIRKKCSNFIKTFEEEVNVKHYN